MDHCLASGKDLVVAEAENYATQGRQFRVPERVLLLLRRVDVAVDLDDKSQGRTVEVHDVAGHDVLTAPAPAAESPSTKARPEGPLGFGFVGAQLTGKANLVFGRSS